MKVILITIVYIVMAFISAWLLYLMVAEWELVEGTIYVLALSMLVYAINLIVCYFIMEYILNY